MQQCHANLRSRKRLDLLCAVVNPEDEQQRDKVENSKQVLAKADVLSMAGDVVESRKDVNETCRIPESITR